MASRTQQLVTRLYCDRGISRSRLNEDFFPWVYGNIFEEQNTIQCPYLMVRDDKGDMPEEEAIITITPRKTSFAFSKETGKVWKRSLNGRWTILGVNPNGAHRGARVFRNRVVFVGGNRLGYLDWFLNAAPVWSLGPALNNAPVYPMINGNGFLNIGNGDVIARMDKFYNFAVNVHDTREGYYISDLDMMGDDVIYSTANGDEGTDMIVQSANSNVYFKIVGKCGRIFIENGDQSFPRKILPRIETFIAPYNNCVDDGIPLFAFDGRIMTYHYQEEGDELVLVQYLQAPHGEGGRCNSLATPYQRNFTARWDQFSRSYNTPDYFESGGDLMLGSFTDECGKSYVARLDKTRYAQGFMESPIKEFNMSIQGALPTDIRVHYLESVSENCDDVDIYSNVNLTGWTKYDNSKRDFQGSYDDTGVNKDVKMNKYEIKGGIQHHESVRAHDVQVRVVIKPSESQKDTPVLKSFVEIST